MKKLSLYLIALTAFFSSCIGDKKFKASGNVDDDVKCVYYSLNYFDQSKGADSVKAVSGKFVIESDVKEPCTVAIAGDDAGKNMWLFIAEKGDIKLLPGSKVGGTPLNDALQKFSDELDKSGNNPKTVAEISDKFFAAHNSDPAASAAFVLLINHINLSQLTKYIEMCSKDVQENVYKLVPKSVLDKLDSTSDGKNFVDFEVEYDGKIQKLSDYVGKGKYVLVDFWASWCAPCRAEIPNIISVYEEFGGDKFEVVGVATWDKPEETLMAIEEEGIKYPQILNAQKIGSDAYGVSSIPELILFDPDGKIVKRGLRGPAIRETIQEVLNK